MFSILSISLHHFQINSVAPFPYVIIFMYLKAAGISLTEYKFVTLHDEMKTSVSLGTAPSY
jgi:hypothetical protein